MNDNITEKNVLSLCSQYAVNGCVDNVIENLSVLTEAYMAQCGLSLTYRTLIEDAGQYWLEILEKSDLPLAETARESSFTMIMPYLSEEFNAMKEYYWDFDVCCLNSNEVIDAIPGLMKEYDHDDKFKTAFCTGIIDYIEWRKAWEQKL